MSLPHAVLDAMIAAGCTAEQIVAAVKAADTEAEQRRERKREGNAKRQREFKARKRGEVTPDNADNALPSVTPSPSLSPQTPQSHPHPSNNKPARVKGTRLSPDWQPKPLSAEVAKAVECWPDGAVAREMGRFRDWAASATGPNAIKTDWDAAWRNWLRKAEDEGRYAKPVSPRNFGPPGGPSLVAHILAK